MYIQCIDIESAVSAANGAMVRQVHDPGEHYTYINAANLTWDRLAGYWRPKGTVGGRLLF